MRASVGDGAMRSLSGPAWIAPGLLVVSMMIPGCAGMSATNSVPVRVEAGYLVDPDGMTLYVFDRDRAAGSGKSVCLGQCAVYWPPLTAAEGASPSGDYAIIAREDGKRQWTYRGRPLYLWAKDRRPGDKIGDGLNKVWHVAKP